MNTVLGYEVRKLFDPVQTHAAYGVPVTMKDQVVSALKEKGATRFRVVKNTYLKDLVIICFKINSN